MEVFKKEKLLVFRPNGAVEDAIRFRTTDGPLVSSPTSTTEDFSSYTKASSLNPLK